MHNIFYCVESNKLGNGSYFGSAKGFPPSKSFFNRSNPV